MRLLAHVSARKMVSSGNRLLSKLALIGKIDDFWHL
jgi:hypothetical protein